MLQNEADPFICANQSSPVAIPLSRFCCLSFSPVEGQRSRTGPRSGPAGRSDGLQGRGWHTNCLDGAPLAISSLGYFAFAFIDDKVAVRLDILSPDGDTATIINPRHVHMISRDRQSAYGDTTSGSVRPDRDVADVKAARAAFSNQEDALINGFSWPVWGRISGIYGSQRILNGKPRQPHYGIDIAAAPGMAVRAWRRHDCYGKESLFYRRHHHY